MNNMVSSDPSISELSVIWSTHTLFPLCACKEEAGNLLGKGEGVVDKTPQYVKQSNH